MTNVNSYTPDYLNGLVLARDKGQGIYFLKRGESPIIVTPQTQGVCKIKITAPQEYLVLRRELITGSNLLSQLEQGALVTEEMMKFLNRNGDNSK